jgi:hypothetical protein
MMPLELPLFGASLTVINYAPRVTIMLLENMHSAGFTHMTIVIRLQ